MKAIRGKGKAFRRALSVLLVLFSFLAVLPTNSASIRSIYRQSADSALPLCGTPMYNDPEYLASKVTYHKTQGFFSAVGKPMNVDPSAKSSESGLDRSVSKIVSSVSLSSKMNSPSPASVQRHVMCKDVDTTTPPWSPIDPTTTFLPTDPDALLLMTVTVDSEIRTEWYYRNDDLDDAWDLYLEDTQPVGSPGTYYYYIGINLAYPDLPSYPRGWLIDVYLDGGYHYSEFFEITSDGWQSVTCEDVADMNGHEPVNIKDTFTIGVDPEVWYFLRLYDVAYYNAITDHCHDYTIVWYQPDDTVYGTMGPSGWTDYKDSDPTWDYWESAYTYGYLTLDSGTQTGQWRIEIYIDTYYDGGVEWYLLTANTFTVEPGTEVFYYYEYDQITETSTQLTVDAYYHGQTSDGNFEIYYDAADPHIDATYLSNVADAAVNSWSQLVPFLGSPYDQDGDGMIEVLVVSLNKYDENLHGGILGYVQYDDENGLGMIYLDNDLDLWTDWDSLGHAFSHEFTHRIQFSYDPFEQGWIMEGMAQFGGDYAWPFSVCQGYVNYFQINPDVQLTGDTYESYYCAGYVFFEYVAEAFGTTAVRTILDNTTLHDGIAAVENALEVSFDILFNEFSVKNYANDYVGTATTFEGIDIWAVPIASHTVPPSASGSDTTNLWATDYIRFTSIDRPLLRVSFLGDSGRAHYVRVIKVIGDFSSYSVDDIALTDNQGSVTIPGADTYSQIALITTRHEDTYPDASWSYAAETLYTLEDLPLPLVALDGTLNTTIVIGETEAHGGFGLGAHVIDVRIAIELGEALGLCADQGEPSSTIDTWIAEFNDTTWRVKILDNTSNLITLAGYKVNMISYEFFTDFIGAFSGDRTPLAPVYFYRPWNSDPSLWRTWIMVPGRPPTYSDWDLEYYPDGFPKSDYVLIEQVYDDINDRYITLVTGFTTPGFEAGVKALMANLTGQPLPFALSGQAMLHLWYDTNADRNVQLEELTLLETYP